MSILYSKEQDGTLNVLMSGKVTRDPELRETTKGNKIKFSMAYGKSKFMECEAWENSAAGEVASHLEKGDVIAVMGVHNKWDYNGKEYQSVSVDMVMASTLPVAPEVPTKAEEANAGDWAELQDDDDDELPF